jgi:hypothetical protein
MTRGWEGGGVGVRDEAFAKSISPGVFKLILVVERR